MSEPTILESLNEHRAVGRIRIVAGYFGVCAIVSGLMTAYAIVAVAVPSFGLRRGTGTGTGKTLLGLTGILLLTFGFARTHLLLRRHDRAGGYLAVLCLASWLAGLLWERTSDLTAVIIPVFGLALLATGWRELEPRP